MSQNSSEQHLLEVERSNLPPYELLDEVARVLGTSLTEWHKTFLSKLDVCLNAQTFAPREEWALRWLLKKFPLIPDQLQTSDFAQLILSSKTWTLFLYLTRTIPIANLAQTLGEKCFLTNLPAYIHHILDSRSAHTREKIKLTTQTNILDLYGDQPRKRRRLSPFEGDTANAKSSQPAQTIALCFLICQAVACVAENTGFESSATDAAAGRAATLWLLGAPSTAQLVGSILGLLLKGLYSQPSQMQRVALINSIPTILSIWDLSASNEDTASKQDRAHHFHVHCCTVALSIVHYLKEAERECEGSVDAIKLLEHLIALNVILPLRSRLNDEKIAEWTSDRTALSWTKTQRSTHVVTEYLREARETEYLTCEEHPHHSTATLTPMLLDIGIRLMPRTNLRRLQREQMYVEALFLGVIYTSCSSLPIMELGPDEILAPSNAIDDDSLNQSLAPLEDLLRVAIDRNLKLSLPLLSYITSAVLAFSKTEPLWTIVAKLVTLDPDVLLPKSGFRNASDCLDQVCCAIAEIEPSSNESYEVIRDAVIIPLIRGFARARDLAGFIQIWRRGLEDAMHHAGLGTAKDQMLHSVMAWADEDVFDSFGKSAKASGTSFMTRDLFNETLEAMKSLRQKVGSTNDVFARVAILEMLMTSRPEDISSQALSMDELLQATLMALASKSTYQFQRWRLWSLLRNCMKFIHPSGLSTALIYGEHSTVQFRSLLSVPKLETLENKTIRAASMKEVIECFHLLVSRIHTISRDTQLSAALKSELTSLRSLVIGYDDEEGLPKLSDHLRCWDGRLRSLQSKFHVIDACVGILISHPASLTFDRAVTDAILTELVACSQPEPEESKSERNSSFAFALAVLESDEVSHDSTMYHQCQQSLVRISKTHRNSARVNQLLRQLHSLGKLPLQTLADEIIARWRVGVAEPGGDNFITDLVLLEHIVHSAPVSLGKPKNWTRIAQIMEDFPPHKQEWPPSDYPEMVNCFQRMADAVWHRVLRLHDSPKNRKVLEELLEGCQRCLTSDASWRDLAACAVVSRIVIGFREDTESPLVSQLSATATVVESACFQTIVGIVKSLGLEMNQDDIEIHPERTTAMLYLSVKLLAKFAHLTNENKEGQRLLQLLVQVVNARKASAQKPDSLAHDQILLEAAQQQLDQMSIGPRKTGTLSNQRLEKMLRESFEYPRLDSREAMITNKVATYLRSAANLVHNLPVASFANALDLLHRQDTQLVARAARCYTTVALLGQLDAITLRSHPELALRVSHLASLRQALDFETLDELCLTLEICRFILLRFPAVVNQSTVDELLASISLLASNCTAQIGTSHPELAPAVFNRLCGLISVLLGRFRTRLQSRYPFLLSALQNLLRCLFYPGTAAVAARRGQSHQQLHFLEQLPKWLKASTAPLPPSSTMNYVRLLTSICDPTTSAVEASSRRSHQLAQLNDETKKARNIAGQYLQYLIMEYARCTLDGQIAPESKDKLMPGLYAVLDCMPRELMRAMNTAMDGSSRAIFKGLYDDYIRYGRWDNN